MSFKFRDKQGRLITKEGIFIIIFIAFIAWFIKTNPEHVLTKKEMLERIYGESSWVPKK